MLPRLDSRRRMALLVAAALAAGLAVAGLGLAAVLRGLQRWPPAAALGLFWGGYLLALLVVLRLLGPPRLRRGSYLVLEVEGPLSDAPGLQSGDPDLPALAECLSTAARDPRIAGVLLRIGALRCRWGKVDELRRRIAELRAAGKPVVAYLAAGGLPEYLLACAATEIHVPPEAEVELLGLRLRPPFLAGLLETLGLEADVERIGKYKSMGDLLLRRSMSEAHREAADSLLDALQAQAVEWIAENRGLERPAAAALFDDPPLDAGGLQARGLVDGVRYEDELLELLRERNGDRDELRQVDLRRYRRRTPRARGPLVLWIDAAGTIVQGRSRRAASGGRLLGERTLIEQLRGARKQKKARALVLRIDSPGGSGLASALVWREIRRTAERMPVVASLTDVAGSGGYYLAIAAGSIVAYPATLTGSIGVVGARISAGPLLEKLGVSFDGVRRGRYADFAGIDRRLDPQELERFRRKIRSFYDRFVAVVAECRGRPVEEIEEVAQGRVWTGSQALERGLVDRLGGIEEALAEARRLAGLPEGCPLRVCRIGGEGGPLEVVLGLLRGQSAEAAAFVPAEPLAYAPALI